MLAHVVPPKYDKIFGCFHRLLSKWQPLRLDGFSRARRFSFVENQTDRKIRIKSTRKKRNKVREISLTKAYGESVASQPRVYEWI